jgi:hypothetical protein
MFILQSQSPYLSPLKDPAGTDPQDLHDDKLSGTG